VSQPTSPARARSALAAALFCDLSAAGRKHKGGCPLNARIPSRARRAYLRLALSPEVQILLHLLFHIADELRVTLDEPTGKKNRLRIG
jgi:hypothetical protein